MLRSKRASAGNDGLGRAESRPSRIGPISLGMKQMGRVVREIRTLRATWRGLETWRGRNASAATRAPVPDPTDASRAGNVAWSRWCDTRRRKSEPTGNTNFDLNRRASPRPYLGERGGDTPPRHSPRGRLRKANSLP